MCDYSAGPKTDESTMVEAVRQGLRKITGRYDTFLISPSGSMLDSSEVPKKAREEIFHLLKETKHRTFTLETRADTINQPIMDEILSILDKRLKKIYIGIESSSDFINKYCINKGIGMEQIERSVKLLNDYNITPVGNVLAGVPILTQKESYIVCKKSINWCFENHVVPAVFVTHIKENTLYNRIYQMGLCEPPSLWLLIDSILEAPDELHMEICWYRTYEAFNLIKAADTCPGCYDNVLNALDKYCKYRDKDILRKLDCDCKKKWREGLERKEAALPERITRVYKALADNLLGKEYWDKNGKDLESMIYRDYKEEAFKW